jgi:hypothetical protein
VTAGETATKSRKENSVRRDEMEVALDKVIADAMNSGVTLDEVIDTLDSMKDRYGEEE